MRKRVGDTLVEVTLAVGIFSMVAIAVVSVISGSTSSAQSALETTVTREAIDAQAEALRFIHSSYIAASAGNKESAQKKLWQQITGLADNEPSQEIESYYPSTCASLYDKNLPGGNNVLSSQKAFIVNIRNLNNENGGAIIAADENSNYFAQAVTYPRLVYASTSANFGNETQLGIADEFTSSGSNALQYAEGIYIVGVKDTSTNIYEDGTKIEKSTGYYDFYIRTCWYGPGADTPSTISTVIRLYDPDAVGESISSERVTIVKNTGSGTEEINPIKNQTVNLLPPSVVPEGKKFKCWSTASNGQCIENDRIIADGGTSEVYAIWEDAATYYDVRMVNYDGGVQASRVKDGERLTLPTYYRDNYTFAGWSRSEDGSSGILVSPITVSSNMTIYSIWDSRYMQDYNVASCSRNASSGTLNLVDRRDNNTYKVRYINGECWMVQNLRITTSSGQSTGVILGKDSNFTATSFKINNTLNQGNSVSDPRYHYPTSTELSQTGLSRSNLGVWYNYCAASAGTVCTDNSVNTSQDICPANWHIPSKTELSSMKSYVSQFAPVYGGFYAYQEHRMPTDWGSWWSSTPLQSGYQYGIYYNGGKLYDDSCYKPGGPYIRCVMN